MSRSLAKPLKGYIYGSAFLSLGIILLILGVMAWESWPALRGIGTGVFGTVWHPSEGLYGMFPMIFGSLAVTLIALLIALPIGLLTAFFTAELLSSRYRLYVRSLLEVLAGIPSVVIGLMGVAFLSPWIGDVFDLQTGRTILSGGTLLSVMILPTIVALSDDAFRNVPLHYRTSAYELGLYRYELFKEVLLPAAKPGVRGAVLLGTGRALGETMAVMLVIGGIDRLPDPIFNVLTPGQTITSKLGRSLSETPFGSLHFSALVLMGSFLLLAVVLITLMSRMSITHSPNSNVKGSPS